MGHNIIIKEELTESDSDLVYIPIIDYRADKVKMIFRAKLLFCMAWGTRVGNRIQPIKLLLPYIDQAFSLAVMF